MTQVTICRSCPAGQAGLAEALRRAVQAAGLQADLRQTECLSGCARASTVAFRAEGKTAYLFGDLTLADLEALVGFLRLYAASPDGVFADARPLGDLRFKALARIPA